MNIRYYRILHTKNLESSYIYKLIIVNGIAVSPAKVFILDFIVFVLFQNCFQYYTFMDSIMLGVLPDLNAFFDILNNNHLVAVSLFLIIDEFKVQIYAFPGFVANGIQTSTSMLVALNRLLSILSSEKLRLVNSFYLLKAFLISLILAR